MNEEPKQKPVPTLEEANASVDRLFGITEKRVSRVSSVLKKIFAIILGIPVGLIIYMFAFDTVLWPPAAFLTSNWPGGLIGGLVGLFAPRLVLTVLGWIKAVLSGITISK